MTNNFCMKNINNKNCSYGGFRFEKDHQGYDVRGRDYTTKWCTTHLGDRGIKITHWLGYYLLARAEFEKRGCNIQIYNLFKHTFSEATPILGVHINYETWEPIKDTLNPEFWIKQNKKETFRDFLCSRDIKKYKKKLNKKLHTENPYYHLGMFDQMELAV